jgi:hypothetical protein
VRRAAIAAVFIGLLISGWWFAGQHAEPVTLRDPFRAHEGIALWKALLGAFASGFALAAALAAWQLAKLSLAARRYRRALRGAEAEVHQLRNLPLADEEEAAPTQHAEPEPLARLGRGP